MEFEASFPLYLMLEQTYLCNLRCPICIQGLPSQAAQFRPGVRRKEPDERHIDRHGNPGCQQ